MKGENMGEILRLQKYIAMCGVASRRAAEALILESKVQVNGKTVREMGTKIEIGADRVTVSGTPIHATLKKYYIMLNKPAGYVSTAADQFGRPTVIDLVKEDINERIFPVGRLDYDTEGLLILTNDGEFAQRVTHPKYKTDKTYIAVITGGIAIRALGKLRRGVDIGDFVTSPADVEIIDAKAGKTTLQIVIHEGKNRQVRRMLEAVGCKLDYLKRIKIGTVELGNLPLGRWRHLTSHEINYLKNR